MALFIIGDLHLSLGCDKPMDVFSGWEGYVEKLTKNWNDQISQGDTVILAGDTSWGMTLENSLEDFRFLHSLPGEKYLIKGNHDYWWTTRAKMERFFAQNGLNSLHVINNNCVVAENKVICGTRGWLFENGVPQDRKIIDREAARLEASLKDAASFEGERIAVLHYPPIYGDQLMPEFLRLLENYGVRHCFYGHIHGKGIPYAFNGTYRGISYKLCSCDAVGFNPVQVF